MIRAVLLDFGGVIAEEGFQAGLYAIADRFGLHRQEFFQTATEAVYGSGYVTGSGSEADFWQLICKKNGIVASDEELRREILSRFIPRPWMLGFVNAIRAKGLIAAILSDQSDWLDLLDEKYDFFKEFDMVFNSYHLGKSKRDPSIFDDILQVLNRAASETLFVDDNPEHISRAAAKGLATHLYISRAGFQAELARHGITI